MTYYGVWLVFICELFAHAYASVSLTTNGLAATVSNDLVSISFNAAATASSVKISGVNIASTEKKSFYLDWTADSNVSFKPSKITVVTNTTSRAHFYWTQTSTNTTFNIELHYVMDDGVFGIWSWAKYTNDQSASVALQETRTVYRFNSSLLTTANNEERSGTLYTYEFLNTQTKVQDETWQLSDGTYYTKYDFAGYIRNTEYQGIYGNGYGAFVISPSRDYHGGGPLKQDLLVHQDCLITNYFISEHFGTSGLTAPSGWTHVYGPWLVFFATGSDSAILAAVKARVTKEKTNWPYNFALSKDYPVSRGTAKGTVTGQTSATVVLYDSTNETFDVQSLGYLYHANTTSDGSWSISNIRPGSYKVVAYPTAGQGCESNATSTVTITAGSTSTVSSLALSEPTNILWSIGTCDRKSLGYKYSGLDRNYVYETLVPTNLTFVIDSSSPSTDWYYAQTNPGFWTIQYTDSPTGSRTLRVALAAASSKPHLIVTVNGHKVGDATFGNDEAVYRSSTTGGTFHSNVFTVSQAQIVEGTNTLVLQISKGQLMYDAISLQSN